MRNKSAHVHWCGIMCGHFLIVTLLCSWTYHPCYTDKTPAMKCQCTCIHTCQRAYVMGFLCSFAGGELNVLNCWNNQKHLLCWGCWGQAAFKRGSYIPSCPMALSGIQRVGGTARNPCSALVSRIIFRPRSCGSNPLRHGVSHAASQKGGLILFWRNGV